jgi:starch phosphorylase
MLGTISQARLQEVAEDEGFLAQMERASQQLDNYLNERTWYRKQRGLASGQSSALGVASKIEEQLTTDNGQKTTQEGYFAQYLNADGWQQERYPINDFYNMPLHLERNADGSELRIEVDYPGRTVYARVWRVQVGTVPLYLLDTNIQPNNPYDHDITDHLYGGDLDMRIHQEMMLVPVCV